MLWGSEDLCTLRAKLSSKMRQALLQSMLHVLMTHSCSCRTMSSTKAMLIWVRRQPTILQVLFACLDLAILSDKKCYIIGIGTLRKRHVPFSL